MCERIRAVRIAAGLTQPEFAEKLGLTKNFISLIENGQREPSERTIRDICRVFSVNESWLRTGEGDMKKPQTRDEQLAEIFAAVQLSDDAKARLVKAFASLPDEAYPQLYTWFQAMAKKLMEQYEAGQLPEE